MPTINKHIKYIENITDIQNNLEEHTEHEIIYSFHIF